VYFIVIDGLSEGRARQVVLVEVKTGKSAALTPWERTIKECVEKKNVAYQLIHHEPRV
jgi:predicted Holliday junction resolvase-like endonuclease